jgi:hypothetical protein
VREKNYWVFCFVLFFWLYWGLNSVSGAGALPLEPLGQPFLCWVIFKIGSLELFPWAGFEPVSASQVAKIE